MLTELTSNPEPGTFAPILKEIPSSGWMRMTRMLGSRPWVSPRVKGVCGVGLNWMAISVTFLGNLLPARM
jgi:hypothetical protein